MKALLKKLGVLGPRRYRDLLENLSRAQTRGTQLAEELQLARDDVRTIKAESDRALRDSQSEVARQKRRAEKLGAAGEKLRADLQEKYERECRKLAETDQKRSRELEELQQRLERAETALALARETLMTVEVKLDILEGAANVLDVRTRMMSSRGAHAGSGASV